MAFSLASPRLVQRKRQLLLLLALLSGIFLLLRLAALRALPLFLAAL